MTRIKEGMWERVYKDAPENPFGIDTILQIPRVIEKIIVTPHAEEHDEKRKPVWLIYVDRGDGDGWWLDCVCDNEDSARYHYRIALGEEYQNQDVRAYVERVPCNHAFGTEMRQIFWDEEMRRRKDFRQSGDRFKPRPDPDQGHPYYRGKKGD